MLLAAFVYGLIVFAQMLGYPASRRSRELTMFTWIVAGRFHVTVGLLLAPRNLGALLDLGRAVVRRAERPGTRPSRRRRRCCATSNGCRTCC
jgi:hypothetical protein